jgi:hypothetical protein
MEDRLTASDVDGLEGTLHPGGETHFLPVQLLPVSVMNFPGLTPRTLIMENH